jgi:hypothetical protein
MKRPTLPAEAVDATPVRCVLCGQSNLPMRYCRHVRWTFDQGDPIDFARFALETSPYVPGRGANVREIPPQWWQLHGDQIVDLVLLHFDAYDGYVFGEVGSLDLLARDIWKLWKPDPARPGLRRRDPF